VTNQVVAQSNSNFCFCLLH